MITLEKTKLGDGVEYLDPTTLIDEANPKSFDAYTLAKCACDVLNYYQENSPDAFGNAPYQRLDGYLSGYLHGSKMELEKGTEWWIIKKGKRTIMKIEVPNKPPRYYQELQDSAKTIRKVFGY